MTLKIEELYSVVEMALNKSPGMDGLTSHFYKKFLGRIKKFLYLALNECIEIEELTASMKQGLITLIPKVGKDKRVFCGVQGGAGRRA